MRNLFEPGAVGREMHVTKTVGESFLLQLLRIARIIGLTASVIAFGQVSMNPAAGKVVEPLGSGFTSGFLNVNGTALHYVRGGTGPAVILIHGFPEDWYEFRKVMPHLVSRFTVVAIDLRGVGESAVTPGGYDAANLAKDIHELAAQLHLEHVYVVGHDIGGMVAYACGRRYPQDARGVMILDVAFPGFDPWNEIEGQPVMWHLRFHQTDLPKSSLPAGRRATFSISLQRNHSVMRPWPTMRTLIEIRDHLRTAFEFYRAFPENANSMRSSVLRLLCPSCWVLESGMSSLPSCLGLQKPCDRVDART